MGRGIGLSIGATALCGVAIDRSAVRRSPVLTVYPDRPAEVGVPSENPNLVERGLVITDFVDRVGDPVPIVAGDGSSHRAETLLGQALRALLFAVTGGRPPTEPVGVTHPAHWRPAAVDALRRALAAIPEFGGAGPALVISDAVAALTALQDDPGVPSRGIVALCDFGGTGASVTLADASNAFRPVGPTLRHPDLSGDLIDQAVLARVVGDLSDASEGGALDLSGTSAIGSLSRLRGQCRAAKERLSTTAVTSLPIELPGNRTEVRVTRTELDDAIREPLDGFLAALQDTLQRSGIRSRDLVAIASVGGGARIPILVTALSENLRMPVITSARPELVAAIGGGTRAVRGLVPDGATSMAPAAVAPLAAAVPPIDPGAPGSSTFRALAWSDADDLPEPVAPSFADDETGLAPQAEPFDPRPRLDFSDPEHDDVAAAAALPWYRRPLAMAAIGLIAAVAVLGGAALYLLHEDESPAPESTTGPVVTTTTAPSESAPAPAEEPAPQPQDPGTQAPTQRAPATRTVTEQAPPPAATEPPPPPSETPAPTPTTTDPPPPTTTEAPPPTTTQPPQTSSTTQAPVVPTLPYQTIPGLPFVPSPFQPQQP